MSRPVWVCFRQFSLICYVWQHEVSSLFLWTTCMCSSRKYLYPSHARFFPLCPLPLWKFQLSPKHSFKILASRCPTPQNFHWPCMGWVWIFFLTAQCKWIHKCTVSQYVAKFKRDIFFRLLWKTPWNDRVVD